MIKIQPVILSGGQGARLWPLSQPEKPKQLLTLIGDYSLLQTTLLRVNDLQRFHAPLIITSHHHRFETAQQLTDIAVRARALFLEPEGRNTAAALAVACLSSAPDALLLALPADHHIESIEPFHTAITQAMALADAGAMVTFGIRPTRAETGYGYIELGDAWEEGFHVQSFREKPDMATAQHYVQTGRHLWNSGMFLFRADTMLQSLKQHASEILDHASRAWEHAHHDADFVRLDSEHFAQCPALSIDHAVMEKAENTAVIPLDCGWSDIGSWDALIALLTHESVHHDRPWGWFRSLLETTDMQVKEVFVAGQSRMSLQRHQHRSEHWLVLEGQAQVTCDDTVHLLEVGESFFVPKGAWHRLGNPTNAPLRIIEVQSGSYLGEDDIERAQDDYGRIAT